MSPRPGRSAVLLVVVAAAITAGAVALVLWTRVPLGVGDWAWPRAARPQWGSVAYPLALYGLIIVLVSVCWGRIRRAGRLEEWMSLGLLAGLAFLAQLVAAQQGEGGYQESLLAVVLPGPNRYHHAAIRVGSDLGPVLRDYPRWMCDPSHRLMITHPAGPLTLFWSFNHIFHPDSPRAERLVRGCEDTFGQGIRVRDSLYTRIFFAKMPSGYLAGAWMVTFFLRALAAFAVVPAYLLARDLYGRHAALAAAAFAAAIPSLVLFSPGLDQCYPAIAATAGWLAYAAGRRHCNWRAALAGIAISLGLFFTLAFAVAAFWALLLGLAGLRRAEDRCDATKALELTAYGAVGFALPVLVLYAAFGYNSVAAWWTCWQQNARFNATQQRAYWHWLLVNPLDYLAFLGVPVACLFVRRAVIEAGDAARRRFERVDWSALAGVGVLVTLNVLGANRGEVARLWMFLMPACVVAAAGEIERLAPYRRTVLVVMLVLQCVQVVLFRAGLDVLLGPYRGLG